MSKRIGFYICHCGVNIAGRVRVEEVADFARGLPNVVVARDYKFMCSDPGQEMIQKDIRNLSLNRVVVASCSPRLHEKTFQGACQRAGLNAYNFQMASVREQVSWVTEDPDEATRKAKSLSAAAINRVNYHQSLETREVKVHPDALVIGGGIAGIQASLDIASAGHKTYLVEKEATIGGHMLQFDKTFPTLDCAACIGTPKMVSVGQNPNIGLFTYSEVQEVSGYVGNFKVKIKKRPRYVELQKCTGCGECTTVTIDDLHPPKEVTGRLWVDRIAIDESLCIHCGECVRACMKENEKTNGMTNVVKKRIEAAFGGRVKGEPASLIEEVLLMEPSKREAFWANQFKKCIKCYGCIDMCPVFVGWHDGVDLSKWIRGGEVPPPFPLFHLLRAYNVWDTCVGCGECEKTCPAHIPLKTIQDLVRYLPPENVFQTIPGLPEEARKNILALVQSKQASSRRVSYAI
jgi:heterodisulfide reductase subunit A-like polyferredoxin